MFFPVVCEAASDHHSLGFPNLENSLHTSETHGSTHVYSELVGRMEEHTFGQQENDTRFLADTQTYRSFKTGLRC